jgi:3'(2'),5'-bisphosphate nucleotidase
METPGTDSDIQDLALVFARAAVAAGELVMDVYQRDFAMRAKADSSPVCEADERSEALIIERLQAACPGVPVVAEESFSRGVAPELGSDFILVDPLDGTREFASRNGEFTVNIALVRHGSPICGVVYAPAFGRLWVGAGAAYACDIAPGGTVPPLGGMRQIRARALEGKPPVASISRSHLNEETRVLMAQLGARDSRAAGSALKFCFVAEGRSDVYPRIGPTMEWDIAAGDAVLRAAGGLVTGLDGAPLRYGRKERGFASPDFVAFGDRALISRLETSPRAQ